MMMQTIDDPAIVAAYLRTLPAIRERCTQVFELARQDKLEFFAYHPEKEAECAKFCDELITRDFGDDLSKIPPHSRWRHLDAGRPRIAPLISAWRAQSPPVDDLEVARRLLDLFLVSVLLDAGAGADWSYTEAPANGEGFAEQKYSRSEGLGVASVKMFVDGLFSSDPSQPHRVDAKALANLNPSTIGSAFQVSSSNPMVGLDGRSGLLKSLSGALASNPEFFGPEGRPGGLVDFLLTTAKPSSALDSASKSASDEPTPTTIHISALWSALLEGLASIWPSGESGGGRTVLGGIPLGDVWPCRALRNHLTASLSSEGQEGKEDKEGKEGQEAKKIKEGDDLVPFHKLTGWTAYSLLEPLQSVLGWKFEGTEDMTGLPEYRNGGLFVDTGVLSLKPNSLDASFYPGGPGAPPRLPPSHPAIIEWRALTVILLDRTASLIRERRGIQEITATHSGEFKGTAQQGTLTLAQVLEACTWKGGREIARIKRGGGSGSGGPPIEIESDGTVF